MNYINLICFRRLTTRLVLVLLSVVSMLSFAQTGPYPNKPITIVLPYAPGGTIDMQARLLAHGLTTKLGQPIIVRNMPGATGAIATEFVSRSQPDGYTLLFASSAQTTSVPLTEKVNYKLEDLVTVSASGRGTMILAINSNLPPKTLKEFIGYAKANPGKISYGSAGTGSVAHLVGALFAARAGLDIVHIPYKGGGPAMQDLLGGQIQMIFGNSGEVLAAAKSDRLRILAVSSQQRMKQLPNMPAVAEVIQGFEMTAWQGTLVPARTSRAVIDLLANTIMDLSKSPEVVERMEGWGVESTTVTPEQMQDIIRAEFTMYLEAVKAAGLSK
jgi:tripartite-type tricarboxylate transporter receptor subunit TctC